MFLYALISRVSCQKRPTRHAYAWQIGPFWQEILDLRWFPNYFSHQQGMMQYFASQKSLHDQRPGHSSSVHITKNTEGTTNCFNFPWELSLYVSRTKKVACDTFMAPRAMLLMMICNTLLEVVKFVDWLRIWKAVKGLFQFLDYFTLSWFYTLRAGKIHTFCKRYLKIHIN